jgi:hypothetical protein
MNKKLIFASFPVFTLMLACAAQMTPEQLYKAGKPFSMSFYKNGATSTTLESEKLDCEVSAARRVPQNMQVNTTPTYTTPTYTTCNNIGYSTFCNTTGGQTYGGQTYSVDANADLRQRAFSQCMAQKGWRSVSIPPCPEGVTPAQLTLSGNRLPRLSQGTCFIAKNGMQVIGNLK